MNTRNLVICGVMLCLSAPAFAESEAEGPLTLAESQMDSITAGQAANPVVAVGAAANATGQLAIATTNTTALVTAHHPASLPLGAGSVVTVTGGLATATGIGGDSSSSTSVASSNEQPSPNPFTTAINASVTGLNSSISVHAQVSVGGVLTQNLFHLMGL